MANGTMSSLTHEWFEFALNALETGVVVVEKEQKIVALNQAACKLARVTPEKALNQPVSDIFHLDLGRSESLFKEAIREKKSIANVEGTITAGDESVIPVRVTATVRFDESGEFSGGIYLIADIQEIVKLKDDIKNATIWDKVSGLYSRDHLFYLLELEFAKARRYKNNLSLMLIDVDGFKKVNEDHGKDIGDIILKKVGKILRNNVRLTDVVGRLEGDRFVLILPQVSKNGIGEMADRIRYLIEKSALVEDKEEVKITVSIGTASYPNFKVTDWKDMLKAADIALYMAKEMGRNRTESF